MERPERVSSWPAEIPASACILGDASPQIWCDSAAGRLRRGLARAGVTGFATEGELAAMVQAVLVLRADAAIDGPLLQALLRTPGAVLLSNGYPADRPLRSAKSRVGKESVSPCRSGWAPFITK